MASPRKAPGSRSVTDIPCSCGWLERAADEPVTPISFDKDMGEYHLDQADGGFMRLHHCPWCGGAAPRSRRASHFAAVPDGEWRRLAALTAGVKTVKEAIRRFGRPERHSQGGLTTTVPSTGSEPQRSESFRTLTFSKLSKVANVDLADYGANGVRFMFSAKPLKSRRGLRAPRPRPATTTRRRRTRRVR